MNQALVCRGDSTGGHSEVRFPWETGRWCTAPSIAAIGLRGTVVCDCKLIGTVFYSKHVSAS